MEPDLRCYHHPAREATSQCDRCGDYLCGSCVSELDEQHLCRRCVTDLTRSTLGSSGSVACILIVAATLIELVSAVLSGAFFAGASYSWVRGAIWPMRLTAIILSLKGKGAQGEGAKKLLICLALFAGAGVGAWRWSWIGYMLRDEWGLSTGAAMGLRHLVWSCVMLLAAWKWLQAVRGHVRPRWASVLMAMCFAAAGICAVGFTVGLVLGLIRGALGTAF